MLDDTASIVMRDTFRGRRKWLAPMAIECFVEDEEGQLLCHSRIQDSTARLPFTITAREDGTQELLRIQRPQRSFRLESVHEGIPGTDEVYLVTDLTSNSEIGALQKPWLKGVWRDLWIVRNSEWNEICRVEQSSLFRALIRTFLISSLPSRYVVLSCGRRIGKMRSFWNPARMKISVDLREDRQRAFDRRLALALLVLLLTR